MSVIAETDLNIVQKNDPIVPLKDFFDKKVMLKMLVVALVIAGLVTATIFSAGSFIALLGAGAALWKIGFVAIGCAASGITVAGAMVSAQKHNMFAKTEHNFKDIGYFIRDTFAHGFYIAGQGVNILKDLLFWNLIF